MNFRTFIKHYRYLFLISTIYLLSFVGIGLIIAGYASPWWLLAALIQSKWVQLIGHSIGMHRYFTHRAFKASPVWHQIMCWVSVLLGTGSPISYSRNHRLHHKVTDQKNDLHSPVNDGFWKTFFGRWEFHSLPWFMSKGNVLVRDWIKDPTCRLIDKQYYRIWSALIIFGLVIYWPVGLYMIIMPSFIYHLELNIFVNAVGHTYGYRNFDTNDRSTNNKWVSWWTLGEGLHNNHHAKQSAYDFAMKDDEFDPSGWFIKKFILKSKT